jgi:hypothetical protein
MPRLSVSRECTGGGFGISQLLPSNPTGNDCLSDCCCTHTNLLFYGGNPDNPPGAGSLGWCAESAADCLAFGSGDLGNNVLWFCPGAQCSQDSDCPDPQYCSSGGVCTRKQVLGSDCTSTTVCAVDIAGMNIYSPCCCASSASSTSGSCSRVADCTTSCL